MHTLLSARFIKRTLHRAYALLSACFNQGTPYRAHALSSARLIERMPYRAHAFFKNTCSSLRSQNCCKMRLFCSYFQTLCMRYYSLVLQFLWPDPYLLLLPWYPCSSKSIYGPSCSCIIPEIIWESPFLFWEAALWNLYHIFISLPSLSFMYFLLRKEKKWTRFFTY